MIALLGIQKATKEGKGARACLAALLGLAAGLPLLAGAAQAEPPLAREFAERYEVYETPQEPPQAAFTDAEGEKLTLDAFPGEVVVVNFWATWCAPCVEEMPTLLALHEELQAAGEGRVVAISVDRGGLETVEPFYEDLSLQGLPIYLDPRGEVFQALGGQAMPTTYILDTEGRMVGEMVGPAEWHEGPALDVIRHYAP